MHERCETMKREVHPSAKKQDRIKAVCNFIRDTFFFIFQEGAIKKILLLK